MREPREGAGAVVSAGSGWWIDKVTGICEEDIGCCWDRI